VPGERGRYEHSPRPIGFAELHVAASQPVPDLGVRGALQQQQPKDISRRSHDPDIEQVDTDSA
jgi:hypothetical protein